MNEEEGMDHDEEQEEEKTAFEMMGKEEEMLRAISARGEGALEDPYYVEAHDDDHDSSDDFCYDCGLARWRELVLKRHAAGKLGDFKPDESDPNLGVYWMSDVGVHLSQAHDVTDDSAKFCSNDKCGKPLDYTLTQHGVESEKEYWLGEGGEESEHVSTASPLECANVDRFVQALSDEEIELTQDERDAVRRLLVYTGVAMRMAGVEGVPDLMPS